MRFLAVDPSMIRIGWALFDSEIGKFHTLDTWNFGTLSPPKEGRVARLQSIKSYFRNAVADQLVCEKPMFFESERGRIAAKSGYTNDLSMVIGTIYGCVPDARLYLYTPQQWKGSVPKSVTLAKFKRTFVYNGDFNLVHDIVDAIMLLRYHFDLLTNLSEI